MNLLKEISYLLELKYVVKLDLSRNLLTGLNFLERESNFPFLRELNAEGNKIVNLNSILTKKLVKLNLNQNVINSV